MGQCEGKLLYNDVKASVEYLGIDIRYVNEAHLKTFYKLSFVPNHNDPVDLMIVAQAITENLPLISSDTKFPLYRKQGLNFIFNDRRKRQKR